MQRWPTCLQTLAPFIYALGIIFQKLSFSFSKCSENVTLDRQGQQVHRYSSESRTECDYAHTITTIQKTINSYATPRL